MTQIYLHYIKKSVSASVSTTFVCIKGGGGVCIHIHSTRVWSGEGLQGWGGVLGASTQADYLQHVIDVTGIRSAVLVRQKAHEETAGLCVLDAAQTRHPAPYTRAQRAEKRPYVPRGTLNEGQVHRIRAKALPPDSWWDSCSRLGVPCSPPQSAFAKCIVLR